MRARAQLPLFACVLGAACAVYDPSLLRAQAAGGAGSSPRDSTDNGGAGEQGAMPGVGGTQAVGGNLATSGGGSPSAGTSASGGTTGGTASASSGSGGDDSTPSGGASGTSNELLVDDMEDGTTPFVLPSGSRGRWYLANDGTGGQQTPGIDQLMSVIPGGREQSVLAVHTTASGFSGWGASVGFEFENQLGQRAAFDASNFSAITFYAKVESGSASKVWVALPDSNTDPSGGVCGQDPDAGSDACLDHFGQYVDLEQTFAKYTIVFAQLSQKGWGHAESGLDSAHLLGLEVSWGTSSIDLWIDDVTLLP